ncbi:MAG: DUF6519 domain-containing protein [Cyanobacteria bacterium J06638_20]
MQGELRHDGSRFTSLYNHSKNYLRVLMQQGRVQVDADWNEQVDTLLYHLHTLASDLIGPYGGPPEKYGFAIRKADDGNFIIGNGHYYVDGILCQLSGITVAMTKLEGNRATIPMWAVQYPEFQAEQYVEVFSEEASAPDPVVTKIQQSDKLKSMVILSPLDTNADLSAFVEAGVLPKLRSLVTYKTQSHTSMQTPLEPGLHLIYLDVWERHISHIEDASELIPGIREVALGGPDTATRSQVVCQIRALQTDQFGNATVTDLPEIAKTIKGDESVFRTLLQDITQPGRGQLRARAQKPDIDDADPCLTSPKAKYRGDDNQLYRVEIFAIDTEKKAYFVWSRENSAVVFPILELSTTTVPGSSATDTPTTLVVSLEHLGNDNRFSLSEENWVEIVDDDYTLQSKPRTLFKVEKVNRQDHRVWLSGNIDALSDNLQHPYLRRWDSFARMLVEAPTTNDGWIPLEEGIEIQFIFEHLDEYKVGDYWQIPVRTATGDVEWVGLKDNPLPSPPHGITHHYAPIAIIHADTNGNFSHEDCRRQFIQLWS